MIIIALITLPVIITPFMAPTNNVVFEQIHDWYTPMCHQLTSRSLCYFPDAGVGDCLPSNQLNETKIKEIQTATGTGYKFPVCARDVGIYVFMLIGGIIYGLTKKLDSKEIPPVFWLILALIPIGIDGGGQFLGMWESTNFIRLITGAIAGLAMPFYLIPILNRWLDKEKTTNKK